MVRVFWIFLMWILMVIDLTIMTLTIMTMICKYYCLYINVFIIELHCLSYSVIISVWIMLCTIIKAQSSVVFRFDALAKALSVIATATWLAGWLGVTVCHSRYCIKTVVGIIMLVQMFCCVAVMDRRWANARRTTLIQWKLWTNMEQMQLGV